MVRAGALLGLASVFIPDVEIGSLGTFSPFSWRVYLLEHEDRETFLYMSLLGAAGPVACLMAGSAVLVRGRTSTLIRWLLLGFFLLWAFTLSTLGSISATSPTSGEESNALSLVLFAAPLALAVVVLARAIGSFDAAVTDALVRAFLGVLLLLGSLHGLGGPQVRPLPGAAVPLLAGALIAAGSALSLVRRSPPPPAAVPAGGAP